MANVQRARHVGRRDDDHERRLVRVEVGLEVALLLPPVIPARQPVLCDRQSGSTAASHAVNVPAHTCMHCTVSSYMHTCRHCSASVSVRHNALYAPKSHAIQPQHNATTTIAQEPMHCTAQHCTARAAHQDVSTMAGLYALAAALLKSFFSPLGVALTSASSFSTSSASAFCRGTQTSRGQRTHRGTINMLLACWVQLHSRAQPSTAQHSTPRHSTTAPPSWPQPLP